MKLYTYVWSYLLLVLIGTLWYVPATAQPNTFTRKGAEYVETDTFKLQLNLPNSEVWALIQNVCELASQMQQQNWQGQCPGQQGYKVAGLCFLPIFYITDYPSPPNSLQDTFNFRTIGFRVAVVLRKPQDTGIDEIIVAGFGNDHQTLERAMSPVPVAYLDTLGVYTLEKIDQNLLLPGDPVNKLEIDTIVRAAAGSSVITLTFKPEEIAALANTREFDFVYLDYEEYEYLAANDNFYNINQRPRAKKGVIMERATSGLNTILKQSQQPPDTSLRNFRTLSFRPDPVPELQLVDSEASLANDQGKHCPPYWRDDGYSTFQLIANLASLETERTIVRDRKIGIGAHIGRSLTSNPNSLTEVNLSLEISIEYLLSKRTSLIALIGRYKTPDSRQYGLNGLFRYYQPIASEANRMYVSAGAGIYDSPKSPEVGGILEVGYSRTIIRKTTRRPLQLEAGAQYQIAAQPIRYVIGKVGVKYFF